MYLSITGLFTGLYNIILYIVCITGLFTGCMTLVYSLYLKICWQIFIIYLMFICNDEKRPSNA